MTFSFENDETRREVRYQVGGLLRNIYPKLNGANVLLASPVTYTLHDPSGVQIGAGTLTEGDGIYHVYSPPPTSTPEYSYVAIPVSAGEAATLGEDYTARIEWGVNLPTESGFSVVPFDVVRCPFGSTVSLNDLREERSDIDAILTKIARRLYADDATRQEPEYAAVIFAQRARVELETMVRAAATQLGTTRPALILDRMRMNRVERKLACKLIYASVANDPEEGEGEHSALYRFFRDRAEEAWRSMEPLKYDEDEDLVPDSAVQPGAQLVVTRRIQGGW